MRILLDTKSKHVQPTRPSSANLLLLDNPQVRPNSTSSYTFGHTTEKEQQNNFKLNGWVSTGTRNDRPLSATPSMIAGGRR